MVEASELHRLYTPLREAVTDAPEITELRARLNDALDQIQDLRRQRDRAEEERRRAQEQLAGLLADQRAVPAAPAATAPSRRSWLPWRMA